MRIFSIVCFIAQEAVNCGTTSRCKTDSVQGECSTGSAQIFADHTTCAAKVYSAVRRKPAHRRVRTNMDPPRFNLIPTVWLSVSCERSCQMTAMHIGTVHSVGKGRHIHAFVLRRVNQTTCLAKIWNPLCLQSIQSNMLKKAVL